MTLLLSSVFLSLMWFAATNAAASLVASRVVETLGLVVFLAATLVVVDTAPHTAVSLATVTAVATALLIPCRPTALDLAAVAATVALARAAQKPTAFVLTACPARAPEVAEARTALATYGFPVAPVLIGERRTYARAVAGGYAVTEYEPQGKAAQEIAALWRWLHACFLQKESKP